MASEFIGFRSYAGEPLRHRNDHHQIVLPHRGKLELEVEGRGGVVTAGSGAFIVAGARHTFLSRDANSFVVVDTPPDLIGSNQLSLLFERAAFFPVLPTLQGLLDYIAATLIRDVPPRRLRLAWSALLFDSLAQCRSAAPPDRMEMALGRALAFMRTRASEVIHIADIAAAAGLSETRLHALFRERLGTTPHTTLARMRLDTAQHLLATTSLSIAEIAVRTGHADQSALTRQLRLTRGVTPAAFRRRARWAAQNTH
jgi:AraC-like DNA-binding protein